MPDTATPSSSADPAKRQKPRRDWRVTFWRLIFNTPIADRILKKRAADLIEKSAIRRHMTRDGVYLDIGSGSGHFVERICRQETGANQRFLAMDPSWSPTHWVRRRLDKRTPGRVLFLRADGLKLPLADGSIDGASLCFVLHHVPYAGHDAILVELRRVLKPGGLLFLIEDTPDAPNEWETHAARDRKVNFEPADEPHFYRSGADWRAYLAGHGFNVIDETYFEELSEQPIPIRHRAFVVRCDKRPAI